ncbi:MAG: MFS transporter [Thermoanaerobaculia bacterium]
MKSNWRAKISWGLYDLANTIFSMNVISLYFPLWIASGHPRGATYYAFVYSLSMLFVAVASPFAGSVGDRRGHKPILIVTSLLAIGLTPFLGVTHSLWGALLLFAGANFGYQLSLVAYNSLLTSVSEPRERGFVSGIGVALGYVGSFIGMLSAYPFTRGKTFAKLPPDLADAVNRVAVLPMTSSSGVVRENAFVPTAILFAVFALPIFLFVRESVRGGERAPARETIAEIRRTFRAIVGNHDLRGFYLATFLYMDAIHTVYIVMATYAKFAIGLDDGQIVTVMSIALGGAVVGSFLYGVITDRLPRKVSMAIVIANWVVALLLAITATSFMSYLAVAIVAGIGLGGVETVTRVALLALIPEEERGRYFGFFNLTGKASSIVGPQLWALTLLLLEPLGDVRFRVGVAMLLALVLASAVVLRRVNFPEHS